MNRNRKLGSLAALVVAALIGAGCSSAADDDGDAGNANADYEHAVKFSACMRDNGVAEFPDPEASGELTIDGVLNGSSLDPATPAWQNATAACKDLQPPGYTGDDEVTAEQRDARLAFAQCMRDNGVEDFPDPVDGEPLVDTRRIPSASQSGGLGILNAAMQACGDAAADAGAEPPTGEGAAGR
jgi:hypothetical protein